MKGNETIAKVKQNIARIWHLWYMKYVLVCVVGILIVGFLDDNSVLSHFNMMQRKSELREEIEYYESVNQKNKERIRQLEDNPKEIEKIAREQYFMKADDEDIFVLSDDEVEQKEGVVPNENAE
jgi:cell division protein FtsB